VRGKGEKQQRQRRNLFNQHDELFMNTLCCFVCFAFEHSLFNKRGETNTL
jgi:hypothetical protein